MTNGEKLIKVFPSIDLYKKLHSGIQIDFDSVWWNAEYKETQDQELILDKIRAEIQNRIHHFLDGEPIIEIKEVLQIIDKYKAEKRQQDED